MSGPGEYALYQEQAMSDPAMQPGRPVFEPGPIDLLRGAWNRLDPRAQVLVEAASCVLSHRQKVYGDPENNFLNIARLWNAYLLAKATEDAEGNYDVGQLGTVDVAIFEILVKVARLAETPDHHDSWVDIAGYAACGARCADIPPVPPPAQDAAGT